MLKIISVLAVLTSLSACVPVLLGGAGAVGIAGAQERTVGTAVDDTVISSSIKSSYLQKDINNLFHAVDVKVNEGRVLLTGIVENPNARLKAVELAWKVKGVGQVINEIQLEGNNTIGGYAKDAWVTTRVKSKLLLDKHVKSVNYSIETVDGIVYLFGIAQNREEMHRAGRIAGSVKDVKKVITHLRLKN